MANAIKPTALKVVQGTVQPCRANKDEPMPERGIAEMPAHLPDKAKTAWRELSATLDDMGVLTIADGKALEQLCSTYNEWRELIKLIDRDGYTYKTTGRGGDEMIKANPAVALAGNAQQRIRAMMIEFGLTPSSRARVKAERKPKEDPLAAFLKKRGR